MPDQPTDPTVAATIRFLSGRHREIRKAVEGAGDDGVNWRPAADTNSIFSMLLHALDNERLVFSTVAGAPAAIQTDLSARGTEAALLERLALADAEMQQYLAGVTDAGREVTLYNRPMPIALCLAIQVGHTAEHMAHAALTRQLWDQYGRSGALRGVE